MSSGLPSLTFNAFTTDTSGFSSFSMERMAADLRCSSLPRCPLSFRPFGTKCTTAAMHVR
ncbi:hypothetical protein EVA_10154 [gut metagenome]|uniref:Uncharacterized protein n=1 Tax=gut metagenome TaxID=749906 RepID=J9G3E7_9ZZZZ